MAKTLNVKIGDELMMRWRDKYGTYDAANVTIADVFDCDVPSVDQGLLWMDIEQMQHLTLLEEEVSIG